MNDTHDYPELSAASNNNNDQQGLSENNAWGKAVPSKKKDKLKKSVSVHNPSTSQQNDLKDKMQLLIEYEEQQKQAEIAKQKEKENISEDEDDGWYCVKADKVWKKGKNE